MIKCYCPNCGTELNKECLEDVHFNEEREEVETEFYYSCPKCEEEYSVYLRHYIECSELRAIENNE